MIDLREELADAVCNLPPETIGRLRSFGIPEAAIFDLPLMVGVAKVQTFPSGFYEPNGDGVDAVVVAVGRRLDLIWDTLDDLIAFRPQDPRRWWRRLGAVQFLGSDNIRPEPVFPLALYETPLSWLLGGGAGACVVDWALDPEIFAGPLEAESHSLKARLERRIEQAALARFDISIREVRDAA